VQLPRDWFGPRDELVQLRTAGAQPDPPPSEATPIDEARSNGARAPMAVDFWGGVAAPEELVPLPGRTSEQAEGAPTPQPDRSSTARPRSLSGIRGRRAAVGVAIVFFGLIAVRTLGAQFTSTRTGARPDRIAQVSQPARPIDFRDEPRTLGRRRLASAPRNAAASGRPRLRHVRASRAHAPAVSTGQPVAYTPPPTPQSSASSAGASSSGSGATAAVASSASADSGSAGAGSQSGGGSPRPGPTGPGAAFGPGQIGK
jgi:hypothetical protein